MNEGDMAVVKLYETDTLEVECVDLGFCGDARYHFLTRVVKPFTGGWSDEEVTLQEVISRVGEGCILDGLSKEILKENLFRKYWLGFLDSLTESERNVLPEWLKSISGVNLIWCEIVRKPEAPANKE